MAFCLTKTSKVDVRILRILKNEGYVSYEIACVVDDHQWFVARRYSEFLDMHDILVQCHGIPKTMLPPKKFIGNFSTEFLEKRRAELEAYLRELLDFFKVAQPRELMEFLGFERLEIICLIRQLARICSLKNSVGDPDSNSSFDCDPLLLHAVTERMALPSPELLEDDVTSDFSHILDYFSRVSSLNILGSDANLPDSNVIPNKYDFSLGFFKSVSSLTFVNCNLDRVLALGLCRETVRTLDVHNCEIVVVGQVLLCDMVHKEPDEDVLRNIECRWAALEELNARGNRLSRIDRSIKLAPKIKKIDLSCNQLDTLDNLTSLPYLCTLNLAFNNFSVLESLHLKLGQITALNLASNSISGLEGFQKLYSLVNLDLSCNKIMDIQQVGYLGRLPCLENLNLVGNPVMSAVDYRKKALLFFGDRAGDVRLDGQAASEVELDTVAIWRALERAKNPNLSPSVYASGASA